MMNAPDRTPPDDPPLRERRVPEGTSLSTGVIQTVARVDDAPPTHLPSLAEVVDPDKLDGLFTEEQIEGVVQFPYTGYTVRVRADRYVAVYPRD